MKRVFAFLLAAVLALSLCACSSAEPNKYQALNDMLDRGDYDAAMQYIENIAGGKNNTPGGDSNGDPNGGVDSPGGDNGSNSGEKEEPQSPLLPLFYGEWHVTSEQDDQPYTITVKEDGTCLIGEAAYTWQIDPDRVHSDTTLWADVYEGETYRYALRLEKNENSNRVQLTLGISEENMIRYESDYYYNDAHYRIVPVTKENWREYFELVETGRFEHNAFGEYEDFSLLCSLQLKAEHREKLALGVTNVVLELSWVPGRKGCTIDKEAETYTLNDRFEVQWQWADQRETGIYTFEPSSKDSSINLMNCWYGEDGTTEDPTFTCVYWYKSDMQLERVQGSLYFLNIED